MEVDSNLSTLLSSLKLDAPWTPPKTWESIASESGVAAARSAGPPHQPQDPIDILTTIPKSAMVRLVLNALHGVKASLLEIKTLSTAFGSAPADSASDRVPTLWCRSSSTAALGKMLRSIAASGIRFFFLRGFVQHYLSPTGRGGEDADSLRGKPPYSFINQAFASALGKVLEGYVCALDTLLASVKVRRSGKKGVGVAGRAPDAAGCLSGAIDSEVTVMEVYLHSKELRTFLEALASICFPKIADLGSTGDDLDVHTDLEFDSFPRGVDLLSYLYVHLRDTDQVHHALLTFLFVRSCGPYCDFVKSWIYRASIDDPYGEFLLGPSNRAVRIVDGFSASIKEQDCISVPCFLENLCHPLLRAGQQLQILVKLLNLCNSAVIGAYGPCALSNLEDILPFWDDMPIESVVFLHPLTFNKNGIESLTKERETMYRMMLEKFRVFFEKLEDRFQRIHNPVSPFGSRWSLVCNGEAVTAPFSLSSDKDFHSFLSTNELGDTDFGAGDQDSDASSLSDDSPYEVEPKASECSSCSSGEQNEPGEVSEFHSTLYNNRDILQIFSGASFQHSALNTSERTDYINHLACQHNKDLNWSQKHHLQSGDTEWTRMPETFGKGFQSGGCWPLGGLLKNPFYAGMNNRDPKQLSFTGCSIKVKENLEGEKPYFGELFLPFSSEPDSKRAEDMNAKWGSLTPYTSKSLNSHDFYDLSINPLLTKSAWLSTVRSSQHTSSINYNGSSFPLVDFSSVTDPCKTFSENVVSSPDSGPQVDTPVPMEIASFAVEANAISDTCVRDYVESQSTLCFDCSFKDENLVSEDSPSCASSGEDWAGLLMSSGENSTHDAGEAWRRSRPTFEIPLDIIIDKCIVQEILLQYKYISSFTIKLLENGFNLHGHLLALRRYHFMEIADWADSFVLSLSNQKWTIIEPEQKIAEVQGLLDLAFHRSSCESDQYKGRLFVYMKENHTMPPSVHPIGVHTFDFLALGYRVDWPVSIIITQGALEIYAEIFSYLIRVRLAAFSLNKAWFSLKALVHSIKKNQHKDSGKQKDLNILMKIRKQVNHFVSTLQQYVHSQLSDVSWCHFQHALKHHVKDLVDIEKLHMQYLADALHICFLSAESKAIAAIIKNLLQCALDFWFCVSKGGIDIVSDGAESSSLPSQINLSQVFSLKAAFEKNIRDLYVLYLRSPKHGEFSLHRFWGYLNYNDYYSVVIGKESGQSYL